MPSPNLEHEALVRRAAFDFLYGLAATHGELLPWAPLARGFAYGGSRVPLLSQNGIFKPKILDYPISLRTTPPKPGKARPYVDRFDEDGLLHYAFRDPSNAGGRADNQRLIAAFEQRLPLIYFHGVLKGLYLAAWPVYLQGVDAGSRSFVVRCDSALPGLRPDSEPDRAPAVAEPDLDFSRRFASRQVLVRLHQQSFRHRVLRAYQSHCAVCRLRHAELLDAAHIRPDHQGGQPVVPNGISLCKLHHAAFDHGVMGVSPDYVIEIRTDILEEVDGPMLEHGLQKLHGHRLQVPRAPSQRPAREFLEERYARFLRA